MFQWVSKYEICKTITVTNTKASLLKLGFLNQTIVAIVNKYKLNNNSQLNGISRKMNCSKEAIVLMILFKIEMLHSNDLTRKTGTKSNDAKSITKTPKAIITLKNGIITNRNDSFNLLHSFTLIAYLYALKKIRP